MENPQAPAFTLLFIILLITFNSLISRDIYNWIPSVQRKLALLLLVWLVPVLGFFLANRLGNLGWFKKVKTKGGASVVSGGFLEADAVFNPAARHTIEMREKQQAEIQITQNVTDQNKDDR